MSFGHYILAVESCMACYSAKGPEWEEFRMGAVNLLDIIEKEIKEDLAVDLKSEESVNGEIGFLSLLNLSCHDCLRMRPKLADSINKSVISPVRNGMMEADMKSAIKESAKKKVVEFSKILKP